MCRMLYLLLQCTSRVVTGDIVNSRDRDIYQAESHLFLDNTSTKRIDDCSAAESDIFSLGISIEKVSNFLIAKYLLFVDERTELCSTHCTLHNIRF